MELELMTTTELEFWLELQAGIAIIKAQTETLADAMTSEEETNLRSNMESITHTQYLVLSLRQLRRERLMEAGIQSEDPQ